MAKINLSFRLCHGPAGLLAAAVNEALKTIFLKAINVCVPDALDQGANLGLYAGGLADR